MCGIAGQFGRADRSFAEHALRALGHRGPDATGFWAGNHALLVHTRLAIIETGAAGSQPMALRGSVVTSPDEGKFSDSGDRARDRGVIVFNGEIYNHRDLRRELEDEGVPFHSASDTELLLRFFAREEIEGLPRLAGMFAFAFWNEASETGFLVRDPLGIKPLYYRQEPDGALSFSSESRILQRPGDSIDTGALRDFFLWGSVCEPATLSAQVRVLPAGHYLRWQHGSVSVRRWAPEALEGLMATERLRLAVREDTHPYQDSVTLLREALKETVGRHMVSDVPIGFFLSGGVDSTALLSKARGILGPGADLRTFCIAVDDPSLDESGIAERTARHFGARHTEWRLSSEEFSRELPAYLEAIDQPTIDGFNTWCACKLASREGIKVVLSGLGGDEIFGGYSSFLRMRQFRRLYRSAGSLRKPLAALISALAGGTQLDRLADYLRGEGGWLETYHSQRGIFRPSEAALLAEQLGGNGPAPRIDWASPVPFPSEQDAISFLELSRYMRNQLLRDSDVFSMAHGLELRVPFVDARFLSRIQEIPPEHRFLPNKQILTDAITNLPEWVLGKPKKGFSLPFQRWIEESFAEHMQHADALSPVPLRTWYRRWAVVVAERCVARIKQEGAPS